MLPRRALLVGVCTVLAACGGNNNNNGGGDGGVIQINGTERIGWDQQAADTSELSTLRYKIWVDGVSNDASDASCSNTAGTSGFPCTSALPHMSGGAHTLELSAYVDGYPGLESGRSTALSVNVTGQTVAFQVPRTSASVLTTADGVQLRQDVIAQGLTDITDLAFTGDGRVLVSERIGRVRLIVGGQLQPEPAATLADVDTSGGGGLLSIAVDPAFAETRFTYGVYTTPRGTQLVRFVEANGRLVNPAVLMSDITYRAANPAASLRFGPDRKLYLALDDGGDPGRAGDLGSYSGKVLRLNADGTTPSDQAGGTPVYLLNVNAPRGMAWGPDRETLWVANAGDGGTALLDVARSPGRQQRAVPITRYALPSGTTPVGLVTYAGNPLPTLRGNLLVAIGEQPEILRLRLDGSNPSTVVATERLPTDLNGPLRAIGVSPEGTIYLASPDAVVEFQLVLPTPGGTSGPTTLRFPG
jgi:glucose/arabinose dehydrogenase